jgi:hypothetical protein
MAGEAEELGGNLAQCQFVHYKSHMIRPGFEPGPLLWQGCQPYASAGHSLTPRPLPKQDS